VNTEQQEAMAEGRRKAHQQRVANAIERVRAFRCWLAQGSDPRTIPEVPSDNDYRLARGRQA
jgi:hypothetical protein